MAEATKVATVPLPEGLHERLEEISRRLERPKSWILKTALQEWMADEERRYKLTLEAMASVDAGHMLTQAEVEARTAARRREREGKAPSA